MSTPRELNPHAGNLADALIESADALALIPIPTAAYAAANGMPLAQWMRYRAGLLVSVGTAIQGLRAAGWTLDVESLIGEQSPHEGAERVFVITALHRPTPTHLLKENHS